MTSLRGLGILALLFGAVTAQTIAGQPDAVTVIPRMRAARAGGWYVGNRPPLAPSPLLKLPIGSIVPHGWLREQLVLEAHGMTGQLPEVSPWCNFDKNEWAHPQEKGQSGWEELPYWLKGYGDLGYVLHDETIIRQARRWIDAVLANQQADGWLGPRTLRTSLDGKPDLWPNMLILNVLQSYYEYSHDTRVLDAMERYFRWELKVPVADFMVGYWPKMRAGDNLESVYWLYNRKQKPWLLDLATKIHKAGADWTSGIINRHGVNIGQGFREPGEYFIQARAAQFLQAAERNYDTVRETYGQFPGGGYAADENCRPGYTDPHQGCETCTWVELMHSFEMLAKISGDGRWEDRCEDVAFDSFPASMTADLKALHYLTGANMVQLDRKNHAPGIENGGTMLSYSPFGVYRCCQHNVSHGWPYYAEELWHATTDKGLCASLYAPCAVTAKVSDGTTVRVAEDTVYPFGDTIRLKVALPRSAQFPLYLRVPGWCDAAEVSINGRPANAKPKPGSYLVVLRTWNDGDMVSLRLPMRVRVRTWKKDGNAVSVTYGPLTFSLKIGAKYQTYGGHGDWREQEVFPTTPWNYALVLDPKDPSRSFEVVHHPGPLAPQPFVENSASIELRAKAKRIPTWKLDQNGLVAKLPASPVHSEEPTETVTLIPMGAARLRISVFPVADSRSRVQTPLSNVPDHSPRRR